MKNNIKNFVIICLMIAAAVLIMGLCVGNQKIDLLSQNLNKSQQLNTENEERIKNIEYELNMCQKNNVDLVDANNELNRENIIANKENEQLKKNIESLENNLDALTENDYYFVYIGNFEITHYCCERYPHICGGGLGITATGTTVTAGRTIAVDPSVIPYGTTVYIDGYGVRTAEDCGGSINGNHIDVAIETHEEALALGTVYQDVWILVKNG